MDTRVHDQNLEMRVTQALFHNKPEISRDIMVSATPDGSVWLRGLIPTQVERWAILRTVRQVPGVTQIFFNIGMKGNDHA
jgi:osmotically-inducible protein OsmY